MTPKQPFSNEFPGHWRLLGEIELQANSPVNDYIDAWLVETLRPLDLNERFLSKILASAEFAGVNEPKAVDETVPGHVHIQIYTPEDSSVHGQSWGFFRVEKKGDPQSVEPYHDHAIAFYLYREGM